jgi:integrase
MGNFESIRSRLSSEGHTDIHPTSIELLPVKKLKSGREKYRVKYGVSSISSEGKRCRTSSSDSYESLHDRKERQFELERIRSGGVISSSMTENLFIRDYAELFLKSFQKEVMEKHNLTKEKSGKHHEMVSFNSFRYSFDEFLEKEKVSTFNELTGERIKDYRLFLIQSKCRPRKFQKDAPEKRLSHSTINKRISWFHRFISYMEMEFPEVIRFSYKNLRTIKLGDPILKTHGIDTRVKKTRFLDRDEVLSVFNKLPPNFKVPFVLLVSTGCRKEKCFTVTDEEFDMKKKTICLRAYNRIELPNRKGDVVISRMKNIHKDHFIPMSVELFEVMSVYFEWKKRWSKVNGIKTPFVFFNTSGENQGLPRRNNIYRTFKSAYTTCKDPFSEKTGLERVGELDVHCLKRTFVNRLNDFSKELSTIKNSKKIISLLSQHTQEDTTEEFYTVENKETLEELRSIYDRISFGFDLKNLKESLGSIVSGKSLVL